MTWPPKPSQPPSSPLDTHKRDVTTPTVTSRIGDFISNNDVSIEVTAAVAYGTRAEIRRQNHVRKAAVVAKYAFLYVSFTSTVIMTVYVLPYEYPGQDQTNALVAQRLIVVYLYLQATLNWYLLRNTSNNYKTTPHRTPPSGGGNRLAWSYCQTCEQDIPARCHHCKVCDQCILKRDHHCYMTGVCIGLRNQRYFIVLVTYVTAALFYLPSLYRYLASGHGHDFDALDFVPPVTLYRVTIARTLPVHILLILTILYAGCFVIFLGPGFLLNQLYLLVNGATNYELKSRYRVKCRVSLNERFREVFGTYWALNWLFPTSFWFGQQAYDGVTWPHHIDADFIYPLKNL